MADDSGQDRTEDASEKRLRESREKGQVARSKELNTVSVLIIGAIYIFFFSDNVVEKIFHIFYFNFKVDRTVVFDAQLIIDQLIDTLRYVGMGMLPFFILMCFVCVSFPLMVGGWNFSIESFAPKLDRLDPISGLQKIFSMKTVVELVKSILKFLLLVGTAYIIVKVNLADTFLLDDKDVNTGVVASVMLLGKAVLFLTCSLILIVLIDVPYQIWDHMRQLKMTKQEVKDEHKESEGSPEVKGKIRQKQREMAQRRMMSEVPQADVVITNPTHFAVALRYDQHSFGAPIVVAKGVDIIAEMIKKVALANEVPIVVIPPLARSLYYHVELDEEVPKGLYVGVAKVLAYVYELKQYKAYRSVRPNLPKDFEIPEEYRK